jgi:high-affinity nickel-transport protein
VGRRSGDRSAGRLTPAERRRLTAVAAAIVGLHAAGAFMLFGLTLPQHLSLGGRGVFGVGLGLTAYVLGLRHAFDADHICAIDNVTRKLLADGKRPLTVGFYFSLGHSTVVFALVLLLALGLEAVAGPVAQGGSTLHAVTGLVGTTVSGGFLYLIAALNLLILAKMLLAVRRARTGAIGQDELASHLSGGGAISRLYGRLTGAVRDPRQMYPIGFLFGLGFDTATEIALLFLAAGAAWHRLPIYATLCLPILFAAGMSLLDTLDGCFMTFAYGWTFTNAVRKVYFNVTITALSILVALAVGTIELVVAFANRLGLTGGVWHLAASLNLNSLGLLVVGLFAATLLTSMLIWRVAQVERRWEIVSRAAPAPSVVEAGAASRGAKPGPSP